jgi:hypothetical protein
LNRSAESVKVLSYSEFSQFNVNGILGTMVGINLYVKNL